MSSTETTTTTAIDTADPRKWNDTIWNALKEAVHHETQRISIAQKMLPLYLAQPDAMNIPSDRIALPQNAPMGIPEGQSTMLTELYAPYTMTNTQVRKTPEDISVALTLATNAARALAIGLDHLIFQGTLADLPPGLEGRVLSTNENNLDNLLDEGVNLGIPEIPVPGQPPVREQTVAAVQRGIAALQEDGHYGPYALVLSSPRYADAHTPMENTLVMPADRIKPLLDNNRFYTTGALPGNSGVLLSLGGNTMDLAIGANATPQPGGPNAHDYNLRIFTRFAFRLKEPRAVRILRFTLQDAVP